MSNSTFFRFVMVFFIGLLSGHLISRFGSLIEAQRTIDRLQREQNQMRRAKTQSCSPGSDLVPLVRRKEAELYWEL